MNHSRLFLRAASVWETAQQQRHFLTRKRMVQNTTLHRTHISSTSKLWEGTSNS